MTSILANSDTRSTLKGLRSTQAKIDLTTNALLTGRREYASPISSLSSAFTPERTSTAATAQQPILVDADDTDAGQGTISLTLSRVTQAAQSTTQTILGVVGTASGNATAAGAAEATFTTAQTTPAERSVRAAIAEVVDKVVSDRVAVDRKAEQARLDQLDLQLQITQSLTDVTRAQQKGVLRLFDLDLDLAAGSSRTTSSATLRPEGGQDEGTLPRSNSASAPSEATAPPVQPAPAPAPAPSTGGTTDDGPAAPTAPAPAPAAPVADPAPAERVGRFYLVDTTTDKIIGEVVNGGTIDYDLIKDRYIGLIAEADTAITDQVKSAALSVDGRATQIENVVPYALFGNNGSDYYKGAKIEAGQTYTVSVNYYSQADAKGTLIDTDTLSVTVTR